VLTLDEGIAVAMSRRMGKPVLPMPDVADPTTPDFNFELSLMKSKTAPADDRFADWSVFYQNAKASYHSLKQLNQNHRTGSSW
jgi:hypothetical protein